MPLYLLVATNVPKWFIRSRVRCVKDRDVNTSFFHGQVVFHGRRKFISKLIDGEHTGTSQEEKHDIMFNYYDNLIGIALPRSSTLHLI